MDNNFNEIPLVDKTKLMAIYQNFGNAMEDVDTLLNALVKQDNVPNDVFEHLRLIKVTHYYVPLCFLIGQITMPYSYKKTEGNTLHKESNVMSAGVCIKVPCHVQGALPDEDLILNDEILTEFSHDNVDPEELVSEAHGYTVAMPDGVDGDAVQYQHSDPIIKMARKYAEDLLKQELGEVDKLTLGDMSLTLNADDDIMPGTILCRQPISIIQYAYKDQTFKALYKQGCFTSNGYPIDNTMKDQDDKILFKAGLCVFGFIGMLIVQILFLHYWPVTLLVLIVLGGVFYYFWKQHKALQSAGSDVRSKRRNSVNAYDLLDKIEK